jgi:hypothetical protein
VTYPYSCRRPFRDPFRLIKRGSGGSFAIGVDRSDSFFVVFFQGKPHLAILIRAQ